MLQDRIQILRRSMELKAIDGLLLVSDVNRNYISGFTGAESFALITKDKAIFITDSRNTEQAKLEVKNFDLLQYSGDFIDTLEKLVDELKIKSLGLEDSYLSFNTYTGYSQKLQAKCLPIEGMLEDIRIVKDREELNCIRIAADISDKGFSHMLEFIKPGMTEREIGLELEFNMKKNGATELSFSSIIASGVRSCLPHGEATNKTVEKGEFLTLDFGCIYNGYCSDMTRTLVIGEPDSKMKEIYEIVRVAQDKALGFIKPGMLGKEIDSIAREHIKAKGYGEYFGHGLGHGVGRQIHEAPTINPRGDIALKPGMVITDEPGIYIPGFGGVRIEDLVIVTDEGCEVVSKSPKNMICI